MTTPNGMQLFFDVSGTGNFTDFTRIDSVTKFLGDGQNGVSILRGRSNPTQRIPPSLVELEYQDDNALLNDLNGASPYYRQLVEYTPMLITSNDDIRIYAELASISVKEIRNSHVILTIQGAGIKRRLGHGVWAKPLRSPAYRALAAPLNDDDRLLYVPLEESQGATLLELLGDGSAVFSGALTFGGYTSAPGAERMVTFGSAGQIVFTVPSYSSSQHKVCMLWTLPSTSLPAGTALLRIYCTGGNIDYIDLEYGVTVDGTLRFMAYKNGALIDDANFVNWGGHIINNHFFISLEFTQDGSDLDTRVLIVNEEAELINDDPLTGVTIGRISTIIAGQEDCTGASLGHLIVGNDTTAFANFISSIGFGDEPILGTRGYRGETADDRIRRLCEEEGINCQIISSHQSGGGDSVYMGPQPIQSFLEIIELCGETDGGMLYEDIAQPRLIYRTARSMHNQAPELYATADMLTPPLLPTKDDQGRQNDVTVRNTNGSSARYKIPDGDYLHYSTEPPPDGMNSVPGSKDLSLFSDTDTILQAAWRAHHGAWRGMRIPSISYQMVRDAIQDSATFLNQVSFMDPGSVIHQTTTGMSKWIPPGNVLLLAQGYRERAAQIGREFIFNVTDAEPWEVKVTDSYDSTLANNLAADTSELYIDPGSLGYEWSTADIFYAQIDGDVFKVNLSNTETPTFIAAGAVASANNGAVTPALPAGITANEGQSLFIWATIRNSGTGTPDDESGWTTLVSFANTKLYHRYYVTGDTAPQITFTGGVANADCIARMFAFSGVSKSFASGTKVSPAASTQLNSSAQNVAYPAFTLARSGAAMIFAWKQDDATGYAPPSGYTEMADNSSTAGDDASIAAYYQLVATALTAGTITVTGGAAAISRAISLALRPTQWFSVERNILGNATTHTVGAEVHVWRQGVTGL